MGFMGAFERSVYTCLFFVNFILEKVFNSHNNLSGWYN